MPERTEQESSGLSRKQKKRIRAAQREIEEAKRLKRYEVKLVIYRLSNITN